MSYYKKFLLIVACIFSFITIVVIIALAYRSYDSKETNLYKPSQIGDNVPNIHYWRTLSTPHVVYGLNWFQSSTVAIRWSPDGKRLAALTLDGTLIDVWDSSGALINQIARRGNLSYENVLGFLDGGESIVTPPAAEPSAKFNSAEAAGKTNTELQNFTFSVINLATQSVIKNMTGSRTRGPGITWDQADTLEISNDGNFLVTSYEYIRRDATGLDIFSTHPLQLYSSIQNDRFDFRKNISSFSISPSGKFLIAGRLDGTALKYDIYNKTIAYVYDCFRDVQKLPGVDKISISNDENFFAVSSARGGITRSPAGADGVFKLKISDPPDPIRVYRVQDGKKVASAGNFWGGATSMKWSTAGSYLAFLSFDGDLHIWNPINSENNQTIIRLGRTAGNISFSPDGSILAVAMPFGVIEFQLLQK